MPKVIENLRAAILEGAKAELDRKGYEKLTIRQIAARCSIAVGTVYNYFKSKDAILGAILMDDWKNVLSEMDTEIEGTTSVHGGLLAIAEGLEGFCRRYARLWSEYRMNNGSEYYTKNGHQMLLDALIPKMEKVLERNKRAVESGVCETVCETMIFLAIHGESYSERAHIIERMIG